MKARILDLEGQTFIGCTGRGIPNTTPVTMFHRPENTKVVESDIELLIASAIIKGRRVPRSPSEPEISDSGDLRSVERLLAWWRRIRLRLNAIV